MPEIVCEEKIGGIGIAVIWLRGRTGGPPRPAEICG